MDLAKIEKAVQDILIGIGEDAEREGLRNTPLRVGKMYEELLNGYQIEPESIINGALFNVERNDIVIVRDIEFYSICEHHLLPFFGYAHIGYVPQGKVIGLSKIPRIVNIFAHRLQLQERLTQQIADLLNHAIQPLGVAVVLEAQHLCIMMRGVQKFNSRVITRAVHGILEENSQIYSEFLLQINKPLARNF